MEKSLVSVLIPAYRESISDLTDSVNSILDQTYNNLEVIIILDDPDNESLKKAILAFGEIDKRIKIHINEHNLGLSKSLNVGIELAKGDYIARMDADDISFPERIATEMKVMQEHDYDALTTISTFIDEKGNVTGSHERILTSPGNTAKLLPYGSNLVVSTALFKGSVLREFMIHPYPMVEDYDLWLRLISREKKIGGLNSELVKYRVRADSMSHGNRLGIFLTTRYLQKRYFDNKINDFDLDDYENFLKKNNDSKENNLEFSKTVIGFSQALNKIRNFQLSGIKLLLPLLTKKIYRDYWHYSSKFKRKYRILIREDENLS